MLEDKDFAVDLKMKRKLPEYMLGSLSKREEIELFRRKKIVDSDEIQEARDMSDDDENL